MDPKVICSEYDILVLRVWHIHVPYHPVVLRAHQNHFYLRVRRGDRGFQIDEIETRPETLQTCPAEQRECHTSPTCQHFAWFYGNQGHRIPHAGPRRPPMCARCDDVPVVEWKIMKIMYKMNITYIMNMARWHIGRGDGSGNREGSCWTGGVGGVCVREGCRSSSSELSWPRSSSLGTTAISICHYMQ